MENILQKHPEIRILVFCYVMSQDKTFNDSFIVLEEIRERPIAFGNKRIIHDGLYNNTSTTANEDTSADLGPVVQSIHSLTSSLGGQLVKCFMTL